jgi:hypothetical protein
MRGVPEDLLTLAHPRHALHERFSLAEPLHTAVPTARPSRIRNEDALVPGAQPERRVRGQLSGCSDVAAKRQAQLPPNSIR